MSKWKEIGLGDIATFYNGYPFKPTDWSTSGKEIIRIQNLTKGSSQTNYFEGKLPNKYSVTKGDILISWSGSLGIYEWEKEDSWLNQHLFKVVFDKEEVDKSFFKYLISNSLEKLETQVHGATMKHITKKNFDAFPVKLPPFSQQQKIANILDAADALRQNDKALLAKYDELTQALFLDMFGDPVSNPKGWEKVKFSEVGKLDRGKSKHRPRNAPELLGGKYPLIQTGDIANSGGYITNYKSTYSEIGLLQSKLWKSGTLCITIAANIAKTGILTFDACFPDSVVGFIPNELTNNEYTQYWMSFLQKIIEDAAPESAQKNINLAILKDLDFPLPPIDLQNQFAERVAVIEEQKAIAQKSLDKSEELFNSLLQKAFKGELV
jgi:type I restriction enzyme S subunit